MGNLYGNGVNPIYESLSGSENTRRIISKKIQESSGSNMDAEDARKYIMMIIDNLQIPITKQVLSFPDEAIKQKLVNQFFDELVSMKKNATLDDLVRKLREFWEDIKTKASSSKYAELMNPIYDKIDEGINELYKAYQELKAQGGDLLMDPNLLSFIDSKMEELEASIKGSLQKTKSLTA